jgi:hypothetical protein
MAGSPRTGRRRELREVLVDADGVKALSPVTPLASRMRFV